MRWISKNPELVLLVWLVSLLWVPVLRFHLPQTITGKQNSQAHLALEIWTPVLMLAQQMFYLYDLPSPRLSLLRKCVFNAYKQPNFAEPTHTYKMGFTLPLPCLFCQPDSLRVSWEFSLRHSWDQLDLWSYLWELSWLMWEDADNCGPHCSLVRGSGSDEWEEVEHSRHKHECISLLFVVLFFKTGFQDWLSWNSLCRLGWPQI